MLAGDALCWSPRVLTGQHRNLCGILPDVETGQEFSSVAARKSFHFIENRQSLAQITQQKINQKWHQGVSTVLRQRSAPSIKWSLMLSIRTWMVGRGCGGRSRSAVRCLWSASGTPPPPHGFPNRQHLLQGQHTRLAQRHTVVWKIKQNACALSYWAWSAYPIVWKERKLAFKDPLSESEAEWRFKLHWSFVYTWPSKIWTFSDVIFNELQIVSQITF